MKVVAAIDSFKGCATSAELNQAVFAKIAAPELTAVMVPIADGGEGTLAAIFAACAGHYETSTVPGPLGQPVRAKYLLTTIGGTVTAIVESVAVVGLNLLTPSPTSVQQASSYGLGVLLSRIIDRGVKKIYVTLGGSGTSDGGLGLLAGLGAQLTQTVGVNPLLNFDNLDLGPARARLATVQLTALTDVQNPYSGPNGFAAVFAGQKGADAAIIATQEQRAAQVVALVKRRYHRDLDQIAGAGAAGGLGGALALVGAKLAPGFATVSKLVGLAEKMAGADLIITGEGQIDAQTNQGKVPLGVATLAATQQIPVLAVCGARAADLGRLAPLVLGAYSIQRGPISLTAALEHETALANLGILGQSLLETFFRRKLG